MQRKIIVVGVLLILVVFVKKTFQYAWLNRNNQFFYRVVHPLLDVTGTFLLAQNHRISSCRISLVIFVCLGPLVVTFNRIRFSSYRALIMSSGT